LRQLPRLLALAALALAAGCGNGEDGKPAGGGAATAPSAGGGGGGGGATLRIGVAGPITGDQAKNGEDLVQGTTLAIDDANGRGGVLGKMVEMVVRDDEHLPAKAKTVALQLIAEKVVGIVGHFNSSCTDPATEEYAKRGIVTITPASTNPHITDRGYETVFRTCGRDDQQGAIQAEFAAGEMKWKKIFVLDNKTQYGAGLADYFCKNAEKMGVKVVRDAFAETETNFEPYINKIKSENPDAWYFGGIYSQLVPMLRQARERGVKQPLLSGDGVFYQKEVVEAAAGAAEGCFVSFPAQPSAEFLKKYKAKFGADRDPGPYALYAYDAATILLGGIQKAGTTEGKAVAAAIRGQAWDVSSGKIEFDAKGDLKSGGYLIWEVMNNKFQFRWKRPQ
jgi:branched-chain amino acid transport system substrate-binding protein